tara:strand:+ start:726 stop:899 length:174 start_codon:yes stop_codon:yes gene_type:complete
MKKSTKRNISKRRSSAAAALATPLFRQRIVPDKKQTYVRKFDPSAARGGCYPEYEKD